MNILLFPPFQKYCTYFAPVDMKTQLNQHRGHMLPSESMHTHSKAPPRQHILVPLKAKWTGGWGQAAGCRQLTVKATQTFTITTDLMHKWTHFTMVLYETHGIMDGVYPLGMLWLDRHMGVGMRQREGAGQWSWRGGYLWVCHTPRCCGWHSLIESPLI